MDIPSPLLEALDEIGMAVEAADHLLLFLDYDGTLAPIVETPQLARLSATTRATLQRLAARDDCTVSIVSGRSLDDVRARVGIDGLIYAGNHGLEISGGGLRFEESRAVRLKDDIRQLVAALTSRLRSIAGILVESKGLTASIHFRRVDSVDHEEVERIVRETLPEDHPYFAVVPGKMVWEIRPKVGWNKGEAVRWIRERLSRSRAITFYLGDDRADEDAFAEIGRFVTARVGAPEPTHAGYRISDTEEVGEFLLWLSRLVRFADAPMRVERSMARPARERE
jgi:trehalose-phosphatase